MKPCKVCGGRRTYAFGDTLCMDCFAHSPYDEQPEAERIVCRCGAVNPPTTGCQCYDNDREECEHG